MATRSGGGESGAENETPAAGGSDEQRPERPRETRLQIVVTWISGLLILSVAGYLVWEGTRPFTPAAFDATVEEVRESRGRYFVHLDVENSGGQSVQGLGVVLELRDDGTVVETAQGVIDWLPEDSVRELVLIVARDPAEFDLTVGFEAYQIP